MNLKKRSKFDPKLAKNFNQDETGNGKGWFD